MLSTACSERPAARRPSRSAPPEPAGSRPPCRWPGTAPSYDLVVNRVHGIEYHGGRLVIDAGGLGFAKYVDGGWKTSWYLGGKDEGRPAALVAGLSGLLFVPARRRRRRRRPARCRRPDADLDPAGPARPASGCRCSSTRSRPAPWTSAPAGPTRRVDAARRRLLRPGENRIRLTFRAAAPLAGRPAQRRRLARVVLGARRRPRQRAPPGRSRRLALRGAITLGGLAKRGFALPGPGRLSFYVQVPAAAKLALAYGAPAAGASVAGAGRARRRGHPHAVRGTGGERRFTEAAWDLAAEAGQAVRIDLVGRGGATTWGAPASDGHGAGAAAAAARGAVRPHLHLDGGHPARRQGAGVQPQDPGRDAQLRRLRRRRHPLRLGARARHLVAALARLDPDRRLPHHPQGHRPRGPPVAGRCPSSPS